MNKELIVCGINNPYRDKLLEKYKITKDNEIYSPCIFLHGELEDIVGHDQIDILNPNDFDIQEDIRIAHDGTEFTLHWLNETGIFNCKVIGVDKPCIAYLWVTNNDIEYCRGYICLQSDKDAIQEAEKWYSEKFTWFNK